MSDVQILIVEDQKEVASFEALLMKYAGYSARRATNGKEALQMIADGFLPDLILLDIMMPEMDGYQFLEELYKEESRTPIPVIMLTALDSAPNVMMALKRGASAYLTKPIDGDRLLQKVQELLGKA